jgi:hypothetical protein
MDDEEGEKVREARKEKQNAIRLVQIVQPNSRDSSGLSRLTTWRSR